MRRRVGVENNLLKVHEDVPWVGRHGNETNSGMAEVLK
jgi:hypothetical protein